MKPTPAGAEAGYADINGARLYYEAAGAGHPLVLLHAGDGNLHFWDDQWEPFAREYRVVRYDLRGFGKSIRPPGSFNMRDDLCKLMRFLGIGRAHLVAASLGASIAIGFALEYPEMIDALVAVVPGLGGGPEPSEQTKQARREIEAATQANDFDRADELMMRMWVDGPQRQPEDVDASVRGRVRQMLHDNRPAGAVKGAPVLPDPPPATRLNQIQAPTLVVVGDLDLPDVLRNGDIIAEGVPGARKVVMHGVAHAPNMERPNEFNRIVLDFLRKL